MTKRDKPPLICVVKTERGMRPLTADDTEKLNSVPFGHVFELVPATKRSNKQLRTYWRGLGIAVKATGKWPTPEHLHDAVKLTLGYRRMVADLKTGVVAEIPDSVAIDAMEHADFCKFMEAAMKLVSEAAGFDPWQFLSEAA